LRETNKKCGLRRCCKVYTSPHQAQPSRARACKNSALAHSFH